MVKGWVFKKNNVYPPSPIVESLHFNIQDLLLVASPLAVTEGTSGYGSIAIAILRGLNIQLFHMFQLFWFEKRIPWDLAHPHPIVSLDFFTETIAVAPLHRATRCIGAAMAFLRAPNVQIETILTTWDTPSWLIFGQFSCNDVHFWLKLLYEIQSYDV